ncbi:exonuclease [Escherichia phage vB_EcoS_PHB17]|uniref:Exonuclease n=1 Tax=Escherichia phage vB_EcoS_PHB17 TaxID=2591407 RepID=A0A514DKR0_9CAUD|nr:exonuclease VIII [Escherichia phage vB_EcoS_PHB17]QDH94257.1 exonuclease [Escherichia phage vB_EcoS_PHB17]
MTDFKVFTSAELSNDEYHDPKGWAAEYVSGSSLAEIHAGCPAAWRFRQREENAKPLIFGTQSHTNFESAELFAKTYRRAPDPEDYKDLITSQTALASKLKSFGLKGTTGKTYPELIKMMVDCGEDLNVLWLIEMIAESQARADGVELVEAKDYDACVTMRKVLESIPEHNACMNSPTAQRELSIFGVINGVKVKVRLDHVDVCKHVTATLITGYDEKGQPICEDIIYPEAIVITDYKTTQSANPLEFPRLAFNHGYYLKMALQHDLFKKAYPEETRPVVVRLLAQEKKEPFLPLAFRMSSEQLKIGRLQYMSVINTFAVCNEHDVWPSYANGAPEIELDTPDWVRKQFKGFL